jgi:hypothetical protein
MAMNTEELDTTFAKQMLDEDEIAAAAAAAAAASTYLFFTSNKWESQSVINAFKLVQDIGASTAGNKTDEKNSKRGFIRHTRVKCCRLGSSRKLRLFKVYYLHPKILVQ